MCGIAGLLGGRYVDEAIGFTMVNQLQSRGPDDAGVWANLNNGLVLAHRRLSILDLSQAGHQPMQSRCGRYTLAYNGEIYNHNDLRDQLEHLVGGMQWKGSSDTETLLSAVAHWGFETAISRLNGMFAFALWDNAIRRLYLARDRMGEKPLYYGHAGKAFVFASELKALRAHPEWNGEIDRNALASFFRHGYVPAPWSIYSRVSKLLPGHYVTIDFDGTNISEQTCYWDIGNVAASGASKTPQDPEILIEEFDMLLRDSVSRRMLADVPVGSFLSGGYDSSLIAAMVQAQSSGPSKTFSIGFHEPGYDEARYAKSIAEHLSTDHTELYVTPKEAMDVIPNLAWIYDEPFADPSQIPTFLLSRLARQSVAVALSGDGGDELFYGYPRYQATKSIWRAMRWLPSPTRKILGSILRSLPQAFDGFVPRITPPGRMTKAIARLPKVAGRLLSESDRLSLYRSMVSHQKEPSSMVLGSTEVWNPHRRLDGFPTLPGFEEEMMFLDMVSYLPNDILTKVDRASMAVSLEVRVPMLDHRFVEFAWRVPKALKHRNGQSKWILRRVLERYVPNDLVDRPKMGFAVPLESWLRSPLREWSEALLDRDRLVDEGFLDPVPIQQMWQEHLAGERSWHYYLWDVLMFQAWLDTQ